jgi:hypothetical protein
MYKNFLLTESEKEEILNMHKKHGYGNPLNEQAVDINIGIAKEIHASVSGPGTDPTKFRNGVLKIKDAAQFSLVNAELKKLYSELDVAGWINSDMGVDNLYTVEMVSKHLKSIGVNNTYETNADKYKPSVKYFKTNSFKLLATPVAAPAAPATDPWLKYPCVTGFKGAKQQKYSDGTMSYLINGVTYFANGRKMLANKTMANYTCKDPEFKVAPKKVLIPTPKELKDANGIKLFQDWLDVNAKGWAVGYNGGIINKGQNGKGYGIFGPRTQKAWNTNGRKFLSRDTEELKPMEPLKPTVSNPETVTPGLVQQPTN